MVIELEDMEKRETQRRKDAEEEYSNVLPPDVTSILTEVDQPEHHHSLTHNTSHKKFTEVSSIYNLLIRFVCGRLYSYECIHLFLTFDWLEAIM